MITFGICRDFENCLNDYPAKADYVEIAARDLYGMDPAFYATVKNAVEDGRIKTYSCNGLFPGEGMRLTGDDVDWQVIRNYCDEVFYKLAELKINMLVFGSGQAKNVPDGFDRAKAWDQLYRLGDSMSDLAKQYGQTIVVEPLRYEEVNIVNTVEEGAEYCRKVHRDEFKLLVDFYHFAMNKEPVESLKKHRDLLVHAHIATADDRSRPVTEEQWHFFAECLEQLKAIDYRGGLSFEGGLHSAEDMNEMVVRMRKIWNGTER